MQMGSRGTACLADGADARPRGDALSWLHVNGAQVAVHADESASMIDEDRVAVEKILAGIDDGTADRHVNGRTGGCGDVHARMRIARLAVEYAARAKGAAARAGNGLRPMQRFGRRLGKPCEHMVDASVLAVYACKVRLG